MDILKNDLEIITKEMLNGLNDPILDKSTVHFLTGSSKRIRSLLSLLFIYANNKFADENIYKILAIGEIIHNASLLHDDVIDDAAIRRNETTIGRKFSNKISILLGDYLLAFATEKLLELNNNEVTLLFKDCTKKMCEAEIKQFFLRNTIPSLENYIEICKNKTAILFETILKSCAIILELDISQAQKISETFGIYFQIKNDLTDTSSKADKMNKINTAIDILGIEKTKALLDNYREMMRELLENLPNNIYKEELKRLIERI